MFRARSVFKLFLISVCIFVMPKFLLSQDNQYLFQNFNNKHGLKNNFVYSLLKDSKGILWIGTQNGLNRFDGSHFYNFIRSSKTNSLPNNTINCLTEDNKGNIWGGTEKGIFKYMPASNTFVTYQLPANAQSIDVSNIKADKQGNVFATTRAEIAKLDQASNQFEIIYKPNETNKEVGFFYFGKNGMVLDEINHGLWMVTGLGLLFYDYTQNNIVGSWNSNGQTLFAKKILTSISLSPFNTIWYCDNSSKQLICFNPSSRTFIDSISLANLGIYKHGTNILEDYAHRVWYSNWDHKIFVFDYTKNKKATALKNEAGTNNALAADFFWASTADENGTVWLGTLNGIFISNPGQQVYNPNYLPEKIPALDTTAIYQVVEDPRNKSWWLSTQSNLIINYFPTTQKYVIYQLKHSTPNLNGQLPNGCNAIRFYNNEVIIGTDNGTWKANEKEKKLLPINLLPKENSEFIVVNFIVANDTLLYLTDGKKLVSYNPISKKVIWENLDHVSDSVKKKLTFFEMYWHNKYGFYATSWTDYITHVNNNHKVEVTSMIENDLLEKGGYFHESDMDADGKLWIINKGNGIYCYDPETRQRKFWNDYDGLMDNHLHAIKADREGNVWMSYYNMVSVFDPAQKTFNHFSIPYAENKTDYFNMLTLRADGIVMGNVNNDLFEFYPHNLNRSPKKISPQFSLIKVNGKDYFPDQLDELILEPTDNSILIKFGILLNSAAYPYEFTYILEGSDKQWVRQSISHEANYNNLPSGHYTFRIRANGRNNTWVSMERKLDIVIKTPFYKTNWFYSIAIVLLLAALYFAYSYRMNQRNQIMQLEHKAQLLEKEKAMVMYESLKQQLNPHFLFNSLTSLNSLIHIDKKEASTFLEHLSKTYRYILKSRDAETVLLIDELKSAESYTQLQRTRFQNGLQVHVDVADKYYENKIVPVTIQNLIENAIKHNIIDDESPLVINIYVEDDYLVIQNNLQKKNFVETSNKKGLVQMQSLYSYLSDRPLEINETKDHFTIRIPLL